MNGVVNADFVMANITTKRNASKTGTTILDRTKDTETKIKNSGDQRAMTNPTRKQVREKEHQVKH